MVKRTVCWKASTTVALEWWEINDASSQATGAELRLASH